MTHIRIRKSATMFLLAAAAIVAPEPRLAGQSSSPAARTAPSFKVDPSWPLEMPNKWILGAVTGVFVDAKQHVWVTHLPETLTEEETSVEQKPPIGTCCVAAPTVIEFDQQGQGRPGLGAGLEGRHRGLAAQPARHLRRSQRLRLDRHLHAPSRDEVHP